MILSDIEIIEMMNNGKLTINPLGREQIQPASVDVRLGDTFCRICEDVKDVITLDEKVFYDKYHSKRYIIEPGQFVLASTMEFFEIPDNLTAFVEGRSSIGRLGLFVQNAGWVDPGFKGEITLELYNAGSKAIEVCSGQRIAQMVFAKTGQNVMSPYNGKYQGQKGAVGSRIFMDRKIGVS